jgi:hypothetical protein
MPFPASSMRLTTGALISSRVLATIHGNRVSIPARDKLIHLQFRRFAGCPICDLHLHSLARRHAELEAAGVDDVVVFHSSAKELLPFAGELPFAVIADPLKKLYAEFGIESRWRALLDPRSWPAIAEGVLRSFAGTLRGRHPLPPFNPAGGRFGLPADFLIARDGRIAKCKYGTYADDQWSVDELLAIAAANGSGQNTGADALSVR